jgi:hypothetical protein
MAGRGHLLGDPAHAAEAVASLNDPVPSADEIAQAEADVACKVATNLVGVWFAVESRYQNIAIAANASRLRTVRSERDAEASRITGLYRTCGGR